MPARACKFERTSCLRKTKRNIIGNVRNNVAIPPNGHRIGAPGKSIWNSHGAMRTPLVRYKDFSRGEGPRELTRGRTPGPPERTTCVDPAQRSEERSGGKECVSKCRFRESPYPSKKNNTQN